MVGWDFGRSLLTGGRCSEVALNTGLTVYSICSDKRSVDLCVQFVKI